MAEGKGSDSPARLADDKAVARHRRQHDAALGDEGEGDALGGQHVRARDQTDPPARELELLERIAGPAHRYIFLADAEHCNVLILQCTNAEVSCLVAASVHT